MNDASLLYSRVAEINANYPMTSKDTRSEALPDVSQLLEVCQESAEAGMTEEELEDAIRRAGWAMQAAYSHYQLSKRQDDLDRAYHHLGQQRVLVGRRSPAMVARLEAERGIA